MSDQTEEVDRTAVDVRPHSPTPSKEGTFSLGGFGPKLSEQVIAPFLSHDDLMHFERDDEAISRLYVRGLLPYTAHVKAREKLAARIRKAVDDGGAQQSPEQVTAETRGLNK